MKPLKEKLMDWAVTPLAIVAVLYLVLYDAWQVWQARRRR